MTSVPFIRASSTQPVPGRQAWPATDSFIKSFTPSWIRSCGFTAGIHELESLDNLDDSDQRELAMHVLSHVILTCDAATLGSMSELLDTVSRHDRASVVAITGRLASEAWQDMEGRVSQATVKAAEEQHIAPSLIQTTSKRINRRSSHANYTSWLINDPNGLQQFAWQAALTVAGERLWDRNWAKITELGNIPSRLEARTSTPLKYQPGILRLRRATVLARTAAVESLLEAATSGDPHLRAHAWDQAVDAARRTEGAQPWAADADATRAGVGEAAWSAANQSARGTVQVVVNELPHVVGRIVMLALAKESCEALIRAAAVREVSGALQSGGDSIDRYDTGQQALRMAMLEVSA